MTKTEMRKVAKDILMESIATAYYKLEDTEYANGEEQDQIVEYINQYGKAMAKAIHEEYYTL